MILMAIWRIESCLWGPNLGVGNAGSRQEQQKIQARGRAVERVEAAKKQVELAASSEDPEVPELLGGNFQRLGFWVDHLGDSIGKIWKVPTGLL